jgi:8-oxo-dGTP diphosphatase
VSTAESSIAVVAAVIEQGGRFLLSRRPKGTHLEGLWEFPGGKVHAGETHAEALRRELDEELGVEANVGELIFETTHEYPDRTVALWFYRCALLGRPSARLSQELRWTSRTELAGLEMPPADAGLIKQLIARG